MPRPYLSAAALSICMMATPGPAPVAAQESHPDAARPTSPPPASPAGTMDELRFGFGVFDVLSRADAAVAEVTYRVADPWIWVIAPEVGAMLHSQGGAYGFGGLYLPVDVAPGVLFMASFGAGAYLSGDGLDLGHPVAFRSAVGVDIRVREDAAASILFYHLSNGSLSDVNPGTEVLALGYSSSVGPSRPGRATSPARPVPSLDATEPGFWILSAALLATAWRLDPELRREDPETGPAGLEALARVGHTLGGRPVMATGLVTTLGLSHATGWPMAPARANRVFAGTVAAGIAVEAIKTAVGRGRPRDAGDRYAFQPFTRDNRWLSFPSGHATAGFAVAAALDREYDLGAWRWVGYGLAGMIAWSRVYDDAHWTSDTVAGAITGVAAARTVVSLLQARSGEETGGLSLGVADGEPMVMITIPTR
jgi:lipid A 3-O-deacylase